MPPGAAHHVMPPSAAEITPPPTAAQVQPDYALWTLRRRREWARANASCDGTGAAAIDSLITDLSIATCVPATERVEHAATVLRQDRGDAGLELARLYTERAVAQVEVAGRLALHLRLTHRARLELLAWPDVGTPVFEVAARMHHVGHRRIHGALPFRSRLRPPGARAMTAGAQKQQKKRCGADHRERGETEPESRGGVRHESFPSSKRAAGGLRTTPSDW